MNDLQHQEECSACPSRSANFFCNLPEDALSAFNSIKIMHSYPRGTTLFAEGQPANGVYILCAGRVKLSTYSEGGKAIIIRITQAGEILGLSASISGVVHEATAQVVEACQVNFVRRDEFLTFLSENSDAALNALLELSRNYHQAHRQICSLGLSDSAGDKLAKLFLDWYDRSDDEGAGVRIPMLFTHEEIAEMIGSSRETVTRLLKYFTDRKLISVNRTGLHIPDRRKLEAAIGQRHRPRVT